MWEHKNMHHKTLETKRLCRGNYTPPGRGFCPHFPDQSSVLSRFISTLVQVIKLQYVTTNRAPLLSLTTGVSPPLCPSISPSIVQQFSPHSIKVSGEYFSLAKRIFPQKFDYTPHMGNWFFAMFLPSSDKWSMQHRLNAASAVRRYFGPTVRMPLLEGQSHWPDAIFTDFIVL